MKTKILILSYIIFSFQTLSLNAQQFIAGKSFVNKNNVYLRFVPNNFSAFKQCQADGFRIRRISWEFASIPDTSQFKNAISILVKNFGADNAKWDSLAENSKGAGFLYNLIYQPIDNGTMDINMVYGLAMLSCDFNPDVAKAAGLFFTDKDTPNGKYAYLIQPKNSKAYKLVKPAIMLVNTKVDDILPNLDTVTVKKKKKEVKLSWNIEALTAHYTGYFIERSEDGKTFSILNKQPHIQIQTKNEKQKRNITYNDTLTNYGKTYYYRIRGLGFFGIYGNYSDIVKCVLTKPLDAFPLADSTHLIKDSILSIHWHMPVKFDITELKGYNVVRCETIEGNYEKINERILTKEIRSYTDIQPKATNYYKVVAFNEYGDSAYSYPMMGLIPDKTPPAIPREFQGKIDSTGKVTLSWLSNNEKDLKGYRIFRNNSLNEELVEITKDILTSTSFTDSVSLETLSEDVFYSITAVDHVFNNSSFSSPIKLKRPDKIKPVEAQFLQLVHSDTSIHVRWIPSTSKDVVGYELWRGSKQCAPKKIKEWDTTDTLHDYQDTQLQYGNYYQYQIKVMDDDGNFSISSTPFHYYDSRIRTPIKNIVYKVDLDKKTILLNWEYPEKELYSFSIYKAKKGDPLKIIKTVTGNIFTYEDKDLNVGNEYVYKIKATYNSGAESLISRGIKIEF